MRTDDFDELKPQDTREGTPDIVDIESADDGFNEFDSPSGGSKSLGDIFRENPIIKIVVVLIGLVAVVTALVVFGGGKEKPPESIVGSALNENEAPGNETTEAYREAINDVNQQRLEQAERTGESTMPIPVAGTDNQQIAGKGMEPPVTIDDPLSGWRASNQDTGPRDPSLAGGQQPVLAGDQYLQGQQQQPMGPDPAAIDALSQAMSHQMQAILAKHDISAPQVLEVTPKDYLDPVEPDGTGGTGTPTEEKEVEILIPAGTIVYAQTLTEANTDAPGPVLARLASGPLSGSRILGTFQETDEYLTLNFNTVVVKGVSQSVNAVALDPKTTLPAVVTEVDHRYWRRIILPAAASFITGIGDAIAQREQTSVSVSGDQVTQTTPDLNTREELAAGFAEGTQVIGDEMKEMADETKVMIKVHAGTPIGILFLDPVTKED